MAMTMKKRNKMRYQYQPGERWMGAFMYASILVFAIAITLMGFITIIESPNGVAPGAGWSDPAFQAAMFVGCVGCIVMLGGIVLGNWSAWMLAKHLLNDRSVGGFWDYDQG